MKKLKRRTYRRVADIYNSVDLKDPDTPTRLNLTIADFDAKSDITNPRAPCVVTTIDPEYIKDASRRKLVKKFRMKTDILQLRDITRKKFYIYATQEMFLDKQREMAYEEQQYKQLLEFQEFAETSLKKMEADAFNDMMRAQKELQQLKASKKDEEFRETMAEHQRVIMEVEEIYGRFLFLLKLISYFDEIAVEELDECEKEDNPEAALITKPPKVLDLKAGKEHVENIKLYMEKVVRPYLAKRKHLNAEVWIRGFENIRHKISNYNKRYTNLALLNHIVSIVYAKSEKTYAQRISKPIFLKDAEFMKKRAEALKERAHDILLAFEQKQKDDKLNMKLMAMVPVILKQLERHHSNENHDNANAHHRVQTKKSAHKLKTAEKSTSTTTSTTAVAEFEHEEETTLTKVEKIQAYLLNLLSQFDHLTANDLKMIEQRVRRRYYKEKEASRCALIKENRMKNWIQHFKKHENQRRIDSSK